MRVRLIAIAEDVGDLAGLPAGTYVLLTGQAAAGYYVYGQWDGRRFREDRRRLDVYKALADCWKRATTWIGEVNHGGSGA